MEESISEAENLFVEEEKKKIIFYYDDFLGSNLYDALNDKKDSHIVKFINRVQKDSTKKFILTSRTNLLNMGVSQSPQFKNKNIKENEFLLEVKSLSELDKAKILYNHIYFSNLNKDYVDELYKDKKYKIIINHRNFNPRLIEFPTDITRLKDIKPVQYWEHFKKTLENPTDVWSDYFQNQSDEYMRCLVFLTAFNGGSISGGILKEAYENIKNLRQIKNATHFDVSFNAVIKNTIKSLLNRTNDREEITYTLFNPSLADFISHTYFDESNLLIEIFKSLKTPESLDYIKTLTNNGKLSPKIVAKILSVLFKDIFDEKLRENNFDYLLSLSYIKWNDNNFRAQIVGLLKKIIEPKLENIKIKKVYELFFLLNCYTDEIQKEDFTFLVPKIESAIFEDFEIRELLEFINNFEITDQDFLYFANRKIDSYIEQEVESRKRDIDLSNFVTSVRGDKGDIDYEVNEPRIKSAVDDLIDSIVSDFNQSTLKSVGINTNDFSDNVDVHEMIENYKDNLENERYDDFDRDFESDFSQNDIDSIFERH